MDKIKKVPDTDMHSKPVKVGDHDLEKLEDELIAVNKELDFQNEEKKDRAAELSIANEELNFQNEEKGKRAAELIVVNKNVAALNKREKKSVIDLALAKEALLKQLKEKKKRAAELLLANKKIILEEKKKAKRILELEHPKSKLKKKEQQCLSVINLSPNAMIFINKRGLITFMNKRMQLLFGYEEKELIGKKLKICIPEINTLIDGKNLSGLMKDGSKIPVEVSLIPVEMTEMPQLNVYETEFRQLFQNLIINAIKFRKKDELPIIKIFSEKIKGAWDFSVCDNGIGIAPIHFKQVFEIFQRLNSDQEYEGHGIGLANCKKIVQLHHGEIWVESALGQGAKFHFTIPS